MKKNPKETKEYTRELIRILSTTDVILDHNNYVKQYDGKGLSLVIDLEDEEFVYVIDFVSGVRFDDLRKHFRYVLQSPIVTVKERYLNRNTKEETTKNFVLYGNENFKKYKNFIDIIIMRELGYL